MLRVSACFEAWCEHVDSTHRRARPAVCRTTVAITRDPFGSSASRVVAEYSAGRIIEVLETRRIGRRTRGLTSAGWVWYTLENGVVQLDELSAEELRAVRTEQLTRKAVSKLKHAQSAAAIAAWRAHTLTARQMHRTARRVVCYLQRGALGRALQSWREFAMRSVQ